MSILVATTILHLSAGLAVAAVVVDHAHLDARVGLNVLAALTGVMAVAAARALHKRALVSPWLALGVAPGVVGAIVTFTTT